MLSLQNPVSMSRLECVFNGHLCVNAAFPGCGKIVPDKVPMFHDKATELAEPFNKVTWLHM